MTTRTGMMLLATVAGLAILVLLREIVLVAFLGVLLATVMSFPINLMARKIPRGIAVVIVLLFGAGFFTGVGYLAYEPVSEQVGQLYERIPDGLQRAQTWFTRTSQKTGVSDLTPDKNVGKSIKDSVSGMSKDLLSLAGPAAMSATAALSGLMLVIVLGAFFSHEPKVYAQTIRSMLPKEYEASFDEVWERLGRELRAWMAGILISMTIMGTVTAVGLAIAGVQDWPLLGFLTFLGTFTPYVGAIASGIPGLVIALSQSTQHFAAAMVVYGLVHMIEGYIVEPMVMKRAVVIHPGTMLLWQLAMGSLFGLLGIVVATPLLACIKVVVGTLWVEHRLKKELHAI